MSVPESKVTRSYHQEDIQQILNLAIARQVNSGEFSRTQLVEIADELGISHQTLLEAERDWLLQQTEHQKRGDFNLYRRSRFKKRAGKFLIINGCLVGVDLLTGGQLSWSLYILLFWGTGLGLNAWNTYQPDSEAYERDFQRWYRQHQLSQVARSLFNRVDNWLKTSF